jgi:hypothetical protein
LTFIEKYKLYPTFKSCELSFFLLGMIFLVLVV